MFPEMNNTRLNKKLLIILILKCVFTYLFTPVLPPLGKISSLPHPHFDAKIENLGGDDAPLSPPVTPCHPLSPCRHPLDLKKKSPRNVWIYYKMKAKKLYLGTRITQPFKIQTFSYEMDHIAVIFPLCNSKFHFFF